MTTLYEELLSLTIEGSPIQNPDGAAQAISTAKIAGTPEEMRRQMRDMTARFIMPSKPDGAEFSRDCFWRAFQQKFIWHRAWCGTPEQKQHAADWLRKERETAQRRGQVWPPKPLPLRAKVTIPQPWDGKEEKAGRVPRDGK